MKLAVSQIAWPPEAEADAFELLRSHGFTGLEVAPPRIAGPTPYDDPDVAAAFAARVKRDHGLEVCSMQSIWFGQSGSMFGAERDFLLGYTKAAIRFAAAMGCENLVFGCPKNRVLPQGVPADAALPFFRALGDYAAENDTVLALEANPPLYGTNFINTTADAFAMAEQVGSPGFAVNLDFGTIIENGEDVGALAPHMDAIHHVHISEPNLVPIEPRREHKQLAALLRQADYAGWVSIEMKAAPPEQLALAVKYVAEVFG